MANPWFRLYSEFATDPKVQTMSEAMQRRLIMVMCLRCSNELGTLHETDMAFHMRITEAELAETKALFISKNFVTSTWRLKNWDKRQFASDSSTARVRKHREKNGNVSETKRNVTVTPPEQNRTEQIQNRGAKEFSPLPIKGNEFFDLGDDLVAEYRSAFPGVDLKSEIAKMRSWLKSNPGKVKTKRGMPRFIHSWLQRASADVPAANQPSMFDSPALSNRL